MPAEKKSRRTNGVGPTGAQVAENVRLLRSARGLSTYELARELESRGRPIQATGITKIESGERHVNTDDLVALAAVLGVNPSALLLPHDVAGDIEITGAGTVPGWLAWGWADGAAPLVLPDDDPDGWQLADFRMHARPRGWSAHRSVGLNRGMAQRLKIFEFGGDDDG